MKTMRGIVSQLFDNVIHRSDPYMVLSRYSEARRWTKESETLWHHVESYCTRSTAGEGTRNFAARVHCMLTQSLQHGNWGIR